ncbi:MAG TPA: YidC/Oxa1 family membrane protein insertase [Candidatus Gastranaerophilaceae bacterium]|nr:YidC/Oxa1 family membrane protein insertase [Candidatus Gastranaerophilaceae bacterium]HPT41108.1 YidC/Oxa1 family membrane protein insertase [Candidatus Gastranaerophilaceae bacterium]
MDFVTLTIEALRALSNIVGNYGIGIILLTIVVRLFMWPLSVSQQRSMKTMQTLQPKLKAIQDRYKSDPQTMQRKMMEFYKEHQFNPMSGCFPLLLQMPIFILLYSALMSPQFIQIAGDTQFLFIKRLDATLKTSAGVSFDGTMNVSKYDTFYLGKTAKVYLPKETIENVKIEKPNKALEVQGEINPGQPIDFKVSLDSLDLKFSQLDQIQKAELTITNAQNRESEKVEFARKNGLLIYSMPTKEVKSSLHYDVLLLIVLFGLTMVATQKIMMASAGSQNQDPTQQAIQKSMGAFMPIMIMATFVFIPIPAGVLLYLISSNVIQVIQTVVINKQLEIEDEKKKQKIDDDAVKTAKKIEPKE